MEFKPGDIVRFVEATDEQVRWGSNDDPRVHLNQEDSYTVKAVEVHTWHTKVYLEGYGKLKFNSVHFELLQRKDG